MRLTKVLPIVLISAVLGVSPAFGQAQTIYLETFESGTAGWSFTGNTAVPYWHGANAGECTSASTSKMIAYNRFPTTCDYVSPTLNNGTAQSPNILLTGQAPFTVSFDYILKIDGGDSCTVFLDNTTTGGGGSIAVSGGSLVNDGTLRTYSGVVGSPIYNPGEVVYFRFFQSNGPGTNPTSFGFMVDNVKIMNSGPSSPPTVGIVTPDHGDQSATQFLTISGSNFTGTTDVRFGGVSVAQFEVLDASTIAVELEPTSLTGWVDVEVTTSNGTGVAPAAYDYFVPPVQIGLPCGPASMTWSGSPTLGSQYTVTTVGLIGKQSLFIDYSNVPPPSCSGSTFCRKIAFPMALSCPPPHCGLYIGYDQVLNLGLNPSYTFDIPNSPSLLGVKYSTQATYKEGGCPRSTQAWMATIGI